MQSEKNGWLFVVVWEPVVVPEIHMECQEVVAVGDRCSGDYGSNITIEICDGYGCEVAGGERSRVWGDDYC